MKQESYEVDMGQNSKFNAGVLQIQRIHKLQDTINIANTNALAFNMEYGVWNYELIISCLDSLYHEIRPKLGKEEKENGDSMQSLIRKYFADYPIYKEEEDVRTHKKDMVLSSINWKVHKVYLVKYERMVRQMLDKHEFNSPSYEDDGL